MDNTIYIDTTKEVDHSTLLPSSTSDDTSMKPVLTQVQDHLTDNKDLGNFIDKPGSEHPYFRGKYDNAHIDEQDQREGTYEPYREFLLGMEPENKWAKTATKIINDAWMEGHPKVKEYIKQHELRKYHGGYTDTPAGRALLDSALSKSHITDSTIWSIYTQAFNRALSETEFNSNEDSKLKEEIKNWRVFDRVPNDHMPIQELLSEIHKGWPTDEPLRKK